MEELEVHYIVGLNPETMFGFSHTGILCIPIILEKVLRTASLFSWKNALKIDPKSRTNSLISSFARHHFRICYSFPYEKYKLISDWLKGTENSDLTFENRIKNVYLT